MARNTKQAAIRILPYEEGTDAAGLILLAAMPEKMAPEEKTAAKNRLLAEGFSRMGWGTFCPDAVRRTEAGKPYLPDTACFFSISDTRGYLAAAFCGCSVGVDIERTDRILSRSLLFRLPQEERSMLSGADPQADRGRYFAFLWTAKEAYAKMTGTGLTKEIIGMALPEDCRTGCYEYQDAVLSVCTREEKDFRIAFFPQVG